MKTILMVLAIMLATTTTFAQAAKDSTKMHHHHGHMAAKYTCTMHPEVIKNKPGKCPKCQMDLVKVKKSKTKTEGEKPMTKKLSIW